LTQIRALKERHDRVRIVVLGENLYARELLPILESGVSAILLYNEICPETITRSLELVLSGEVIFPLSLFNGLKDWLQSSKESLVLRTAPHIIPGSQVGNYGPSTMQNEADIHLSAREKAILRHLMRGASNKLIARELDVAEATIKVHVRAVLRKIRASNPTQAAMWAHKFLSPVAESSIPDPDAVPTNARLQ
jgi:two-component system, NarL family, nitrate/nitrite response regulator NarL